MDANYGFIDDVIIENLERYHRHHVDPGDFLIAVLSNDLREAFGRADDASILTMFHIVSYCWNELPGICWGSRAAVDKWLSQRESVQG